MNIPIKAFFKKFKNHFAAAAVFFAVSAAILLILLQKPGHMGIQDWDEHYVYAEANIRSLFRYGQFPLWNPYHCGGLTQIGNPQNDILPTTIAATALFGAVIGYKAVLILSIFAGLVGFYVLGLHYGISRLGSTYLGLVYMLSGMIFMPFSTGMTNFLMVSLLPWLHLVYLNALAKREFKHVFFAALILALMFFGGYHYFPHMVIYLAVLTISKYLLHRDRKVFAIFGLFVVLFAMISAVKLIPSLETSILKRRQIAEPASGYSIRSLAYSAFSPRQDFDGFYNVGKWQANGFMDGVSYDLDENGMYVGLLVLPMFVWGLITHFRRKRELAVVFAFFLVLSFGFNIWPSLYGLLKQLPYFSDMRVAQRFHVFFMLPFVVFAGFGLDSVRGFISGKTGSDTAATVLALAFVAVSAVNILSVNSRFLLDSLDIPPEKVPPVQQFTFRCGLNYRDSSGRNVPHRQNGTAYADEYPQMVAGYGSTDCYEALPVYSYALCKDSASYRGEHYLAYGRGKLTETKWSPNVLSYRVEINGTDILIVNQNYYPGWRAIKNGYKVVNVENTNGLISVPVSGNDDSVTLFYLPSSFIAGMLISIAAIVIFFKFRRNRLQ